jgi:anti-sigma factor RsiW
MRRREPARRGLVPEQRLVTWLSAGLPASPRICRGSGFRSWADGSWPETKTGRPVHVEDADRHRISLLVRKDNIPSNETAFRYAYEDGVGVFYWIDENCGYAISGRIDKGQLLSIARVVYGQLAAFEAAPPPRP